jgi:hypothetical protein
VVDHHVGVESDAMRVRFGDQRLQLSSVPKLGFLPALLVKVTQVEIVIRVVAH